MDEDGHVNERFKTPEQGASTSVWAAVAPELEGIGGLYLENCGEAPPFDKANPTIGTAVISNLSPVEKLYPSQREPVLSAS